MDKNISDHKWQIKVSTNLHQASPQQIWPSFKDFFGIHKWFPGLAASHGVEGSNGEPGCVRLCSGFGLKRENSNSNIVSWSKERLVVIDHEQMTFTYEMVDSSLGFKSYVSTVKVVAAESTVEWCISLDPVVGWRREDLVVKYERGLKGMIEKMEAAIKISNACFSI